ncbi:glycoside hydrolase family 2 protein, partial [Plectosphaerella plurivora]
MASFPPTIPDWNNLQVLHRNTITPRASFFNFHTTEEALTYDVNQAQALSLGGSWKFHLAQSPFEAPPMHENDFDPSGWSNVEIPSMWTGGFGGPQYLNKQYGFPVDPPNVPFEENQTGSYTRRFNLPESFSGSQIRLRFEGVDSGFHVWLNGTEVGYSQGARNPSEFDITSLVRSGENVLCVRVYQYCDGSYIESQDQWRGSGIYRDVFLVAFPEDQIEDFHVVTDFDSSYKNATLSVDVETKGEGEVSLALYDGGKTQIIVSECKPAPAGQGRVSFSIPVISPLHWTAETPNLYHLCLTLGKQTVAQRVGFRKVEIKDGLIKVNGKRVVFRGANRHEHHPTMGRTVPYDYLRRDLLLMKRHNLNAIRTCHQPSDPRLYDLADELGIWIMDEADLECHGYEIVENANLSKTERLLTEDEAKAISFWRAGRWLSDNLDWEAAYVDRAKQMVARDKNHPSVVIWSLGNEAFQGRNFQAMYDWVKSYDATRPVHYEADVDARIVDVVSTMYPSLEKMRSFAEDWDGKKPLLLCEYIHAMGNGPGNIREYIDLFYEHAPLQGGWVWEWANHGVLTKSAEGDEYHGYGGDFGETQHDGHFLLDGVLSSWHDPTPALLEYAKALEPVRLVSCGSEAFKIVNRHDFLDLTGLRADHKIVGADFVKELGELSLPHVPAGEEADIQIPDLGLENFSAKDGVYLEVSFRQRNDSPGIQAGTEVAWSQVPVAQPTHKEVFPASSDPVSIRQKTSTKLEIESSECRWVFDVLGGGDLASWTKDGAALVQSGPQLGVWRAPIDNDIYLMKDWAEKQVSWARPHTRSAEWRVDAESGAAVVVVQHRLAPRSLEWAIEATMTYTFWGSHVLISVSGKPTGRSVPEVLPRIGLTLGLVPGFEQTTWFGRGPSESYRDKAHAQRFGLFSSSVEDLAEGYEFPQEYGNHTNTRWVRFDNADTGAGLRACFIDKHDGFDFQASHYDVEDVERAQHTYELKKHRRDETIVRLDFDHQGLGSAACGPPALPENTLWTKPFEFKVLLE